MMRTQNTLNNPLSGPEENGAMAAALSRVRRSGHRLLSDDGGAPKWRLSSRILLQPSPEDGVGVVIDTYTARFCRCNGTAWSMLRTLADGADLDQLVNAVTSEYQAEPDLVREDALDFIARMKRAEFVDEG